MKVDSGVHQREYALIYDAEIGGQPYDRELTWAVHSGPTPEANTFFAGDFDPTPIHSDYHPLIQQAFDTWEAVSGITFTRLPDGSPDANISLGWADGIDAIATGTGWQHPWGWRGYVTLLKGWFEPIPGDPVGIDYPGSYFVFLHEIGHALGIDHSDVEGVVLSGPPNSQYLFVDGWVDLQPDDIAAVQAVWGPPGDLPPNLEETGQYFAHSWGYWEFRARGTSGDDTMAGNENLASYNFDDLFAGGFGADFIDGGGGDDTLMGNGVYWTNWNNPAHDYWSRSYTAEDDSDTIYGGAGNDRINGNAGLDYLDGGPGNDTIYGGQNAGAWAAGKTRANTIHLRDGQDTLVGGDGDDWMNGNMGGDILYGGPGDDWMRGGQDADSLYGGFDDDTLWGDLEGDTLDGGAGADQIILGNDKRFGDGHVDHVHFSGQEAQGDTIYGFENHDVLWVDGTIATQAQVEALGVTFSQIAVA